MHNDSFHLGLVARFELTARVCALAVVALGALVLVGWALDIAALKQVLPGLSSMKPNTAVSFMLLGTALAAAGRRRVTPAWHGAQLALAAAVTLLGLLTLEQYLLAVDWGMDQLLFVDPGGGEAPGRMAAATASGLLLAGLALLLLDSRWRVAAQIVALLGALVGLLALFGYAYDVAALYGVGAYSSVALHTAAGLLVINLGVFVVRPQRGLMTVVTSRGADGMMVRRLLPFAFVAPFLIGWLRIKSELWGLVDPQMGIVLVQLTYLTLFTAFIWGTAQVTRRSDRSRSAAEQGRRQLQAQLSGIIDSAMDAIIMVDAAQRVILFNPAAAQLFGRQAAEVLGGPLDVLLPRRFRATHAGQVAGFGATGETSRRMGRLGAVTGLRANGEEFPMEAAISQLEVDGAKYYTVILRDVTARQRLQQTLRDSEQRYMTLASGTFEGVVVSEFGRMLDVNAQFARLLGYEREELIGRPASDWIPHESLGPAMAALLSKHESCIEHEVVCRDGTRRLVEAHGQAFVQDGRRIRLTALRDITQRKRAEQELRASEQQFRAYFETEAFGAAMVSLDGRFLRVNGALCAMHGYDAVELLRMGPVALAHPDEVERRAGARAAYLRGSAPTYYVEKRNLRKDGSLIWVQIAASLVRDDHGAARYSVETVHDITARKRDEARLKAAIVEAERADNAKSRFLAAASHDLRQPLAALKIYANVLSERVPPDDRKLFANMQDCVAGLSGLLNDLLDLSKLAAGVVNAHVDDFPIADVLANLAFIHAPAAREKGLRLRCVGSALATRTDPILLRRILGNFIDNAICYTEHGGVLVGCRRRQGKTWVEVWDSGCGFPAENAEEIFEEFKQLGDAARNRGSGLGLAIVAKTAALLKLDIRFRSTPGHGSMFAIEIPRGQPKAIQPPPAAAAAACRALRIALVEDNGMVREALALAMANAGHEVVSAASGAEILAALGTRAPDIVVSDYRLTQGATGYDVIAALRQRMGAELPAIIITGDTDPRLMRGMAERGIVVLHKPVDLEELQAYLEDLTYPAAEA